MAKRTFSLKATATAAVTGFLCLITHFAMADGKVTLQDLVDSKFDEAFLENPPDEVVLPEEMKKAFAEMVGMTSKKKVEHAACFYRDSDGQIKPVEIIAGERFQISGKKTDTSCKKKNDIVAFAHTHPILDGKVDKNYATPSSADMVTFYSRPFSTSIVIHSKYICITAKQRQSDDYFENTGFEQLIGYPYGDYLSSLFNSDSAKPDGYATKIWISLSTTLARNKMLLYCGQIGEKVALIKPQTLKPDDVNNLMAARAMLIVDYLKSKKEDNIPVPTFRFSPDDNEGLFKYMRKRWEEPLTTQLERLKSNVILRFVAAKSCCEAGAIPNGILYRSGDNLHADVEFTCERKPRLSCTLLQVIGENEGANYNIAEYIDEDSVLITSSPTGKNTRTQVQAYKGSTAVLSFKEALANGVWMPVKDSGILKGSARTIIGSVKDSTIFGPVIVIEGGKKYKGNIDEAGELTLGELVK